ncbi:hypothetical protein IOK49_05160 [Fervidicoccus fontis]|jgi:predicted RND superfamily exporter protein|uniref:Uncharacterized protein n=2 Tax=Fervidicoccus fontis TaxID=683846 RepID=I0A1Y0_FERFK|nr:hypothetical protein [Fervidicoccus fontis]AFH42987.1 hypothetical protein FFONT_0999 [Fervidicoccus fontis Kam940]MBE9391459.1 hypothetical protein [Fervidicoccus fontis]PMB75464.1 MAG: hypothetical protein C0188_03025 [Fervidicoccus fontis]PMB77329.1 MAG: hypothetical protein C0177_03465 [Fervidicoccus fontis]PMB78613.1 MAG: hypothetical protein C0177_00025 [Fervidicoccus fontis]
MRAKFTANIDILDYYIGGLVDRIVMKGYYDIDLDREYDHLMWYIYEKLVVILFKGKEPTREEFEEKMKKIRRRDADKLKVLISYLISKYMKMRNIQSTGKRSQDDF